MLRDGDGDADLAQQRELILVVAWLLQRNLLMRMHRFVQFVPTAANTSTSHIRIRRAQDGDSERMARLFERAKPFLNGQNHWLEILFQINFSANKLQLVLEHFKEQLICFTL